jgi:hypothetical protein
MKKVEAYFAYSVAVIIFIAALTILLAAFGNNGALDQPDPLLFLKNRIVFFLAAAFEIILSAFLLVGKDNWLKLILVAWVATTFLAYQLGVWWINGPNVYTCLGNLTSALPVHPRTLNEIIFVLLGYFLLGAYVLLALNWINQRRGVIK